MSLHDAYTWLRDYLTAIRAGQLHPFTHVERLAREATRRDPWGPTGLQLAELADATHHPEHCHVIVAVLEYRLTRPPEKWRNVYKALMVTEYLLKRGAPPCVPLARAELAPLIAALRGFTSIDADGRDHGMNVRVRSVAVLALLEDDALLQSERAAAAARAGALSYPGFGREPWGAAGATGYTGYAGYGGAAATGGSALTGASFQWTGSGGGRWAGRAAAGGHGGHGGYGSFGSAGFNKLMALTGGDAPGGGAFDRQLPPPPRQQEQWQAAGAAAAHSAPLPPLQQPWQQQQQQPAAGAAGGNGAGRGFGEAKGVSFEENAARLAELRRLLQLSGNRICADCRDDTAAAAPTWASINLGVFICMQCAGLHRGLGTHISKVRSTTLDTWLPEQVAFMAAAGNAAANAHFEARMPPGARPPRGAAAMGAFLRAKYAERRWAGAGPWPPPPAAPAAAPAAAVAAAGGRRGKEPAGPAAVAVAAAAAGPARVPAPPAPAPVAARAPVAAAAPAKPKAATAAPAVRPAAAAPATEQQQQQQQAKQQQQQQAKQQQRVGPAVGVLISLDEAPPPSDSLIDQHHPAVPSIPPSAPPPFTPPGAPAAAAAAAAAAASAAAAARGPAEERARCRGAGRYRGPAGTLGWRWPRLEGAVRAERRRRRRRRSHLWRWGAPRRPRERMGT